MNWKIFFVIIILILAILSRIFIDDVLDAIEKATIIKEIEGMKFNIGSGQTCTVNEILKIASKVLPFHFRITHTKQKRESSVNCSKPAFIENTKTKLKWNPKITVEEGLKKTYEWYVKNLESIRNHY